MAVRPSAAYPPYGPLASFNFGNGAKRAMTFDSRYRITENKLFNPPNTIARYTYSYDAGENITAIQDLVDATYTRNFGYDDLNRLITANTGTSLWGTGSYSYDAMGNLTSRSLGTPPVDTGQPLSIGRPFHASTTVTGQVDRLAFTFAGTTPKISFVTANGLDHTVAYDAAGNETGYLANRTYSARNLMNAVADTSGEGPAHQITYGYDWRGVRVSRTETPTDAGSASRYFFYSPELQLLESTVDDSNNVWGQSAHHIASAPLIANRDIIWFNGAPVAEIGPPRTSDNTPLSTHRTFVTALDATNTFWTFTDHLGTPLIQTDTTSTIVWRAEHEPYGNVWKMRAGARTDQPLRFPGQELAMTWEGGEEDYNVARFYRSSWGRYSQSDPVALNGGMNLYRYASDDPIEYTDPLGLVTWSKNAPVYHSANWDTVFKHCKDWKAHGCTVPFVHTTCTCMCWGNGIYRASVDLSMNIDVWARNDDPKASLLLIMKEETKHVWYFEAMFKWAVKRGEQIEAKTFSSKKDCDGACQGYYDATYGDFSSDWVHKNNPHPQI